MPLDMYLTDQNVLGSYKGANYSKKYGNLYKPKYFVPYHYKILFELSDQAENYNVLRKEIILYIRKFRNVMPNEIINYILNNCHMSLCIDNFFTQ